MRLVDGSSMPAVDPEGVVEGNRLRECKTRDVLWAGLVEEGERGQRDERQHDPLPPVRPQHDHRVADNLATCKPSHARSRPDPAVAGESDTYPTSNVPRCKP